jgi:hypothetical protein
LVVFTTILEVLVVLVIGPVLVAVVVVVVREGLVTIVCNKIFPVSKSPEPSYYRTKSE